MRLWSIALKGTVLVILEYEVHGKTLSERCALRQQAHLGWSQLKAEKLFTGSRLAWALLSCRGLANSKLFSWADNMTDDFVQHS